MNFRNGKPVPTLVHARQPCELVGAEQLHSLGGAAAAEHMLVITAGGVAPRGRRRERATDPDLVAVTAGGAAGAIERHRNAYPPAIRRLF